MNTVVVNSRAGQRSNRLVTIAHAMATAIASGATLRLTTFCQYKDDYKCEVTWGGAVIISKSIWWEFVRLLIACLKRVGVKKVFPFKIFSDWTGRNHDALRKYELEIRRFFTPKCDYSISVRDAGVVLVGVHKRRGDYKDYLGGLYYFEDDVYEKNMQSLKHDLEHKGKKVQFVIFPREDAVRDQWFMSRCDYLMGPPSTFTMWASFMGQVPLGIITEKNTCLTLDDFVYRGLIA